MERMEAVRKQQDTSYIIPVDNTKTLRAGQLVLTTFLWTVLEITTRICGRGPCVPYWSAVKSVLRHGVAKGYRKGDKHLRQSCKGDDLALYLVVLLDSGYDELTSDTDFMQTFTTHTPFSDDGKELPVKSTERGDKTSADDEHHQTPHFV